MITASIVSVALRHHQTIPTDPSIAAGQAYNSPSETSPRESEQGDRSVRSTINGGDSTTTTNSNPSPPLPPSSSTSVAIQTTNKTGGIEMAWKPRKLVLIWCLVLAVGVLAGMVGLGGGVLIAPLMIELGIHPQAAAATSTLIVLFSSTIATITFGLYGRLNLSYFAVYGPVAFVGGLFGVFVLSGIVRRWRMASVVTLALAAMVVVSAGLVAGFALRRSIEAVVDGGGVIFADFCTN